MCGERERESAIEEGGLGGIIVLARSGRGQGRLGPANDAGVKKFPYILCQEL